MRFLKFTLSSLNLLWPCPAHLSSLIEVVESRLGTRLHGAHMNFQGTVYQVDLTHNSRSTVVVYWMSLHRLWSWFLTFVVLRNTAFWSWSWLLYCREGNVSLRFLSNFVILWYSHICLLKMCSSNLQMLAVHLIFVLLVHRLNQSKYLPEICKELLACCLTTVREMYHDAMSLYMELCNNLHTLA